MNQSPVNRPVRVRGGRGATITVRRSTAVGHPYVFDVVWPDGKQETVCPEGQAAVNALITMDYARAFVVEVVESGDF
jgi:hypothetical protein